MLARIQICAPTSDAEDDQIGKFYQEFDTQIEQMKTKNNDLIIMGDWNSQIGQGEKREIDIK